MRKLLTLLCLALIANVAIAQEETKKGDEFIGHWFIQAQGGAAYTSGETDFGKLISPAASISAGYQFTPVWGLRLNVTGWQAKGAIVYPQYVYKFNYVQGSFDVMVDICNMFADYKVKRAVTPYLFAGVGAAYAFNNDEANKVFEDVVTKPNHWSDDLVTPVGRFGLGMNVRLVDAVHFNIEVNGNMYNDKLNSKEGTKLDWQVNALAGFTFKIGVNKGRKAVQEPAPEVAPEPVAETVPAEKIVPAEDPTPKFERKDTESVVLKEVKEDIFFLIGKTDIRKSEEEKIADLIKVMQESPVAKVVITGYADANTGNPRINMELSKKRAENVAKALIDGGISADRVVVEYKGDTVAPYETAAKNRVAICLVK